MPVSVPEAAVVKVSHEPTLEVTVQLSEVPAEPVFEMVNTPVCFAVSPSTAENEKLEGV